MNMKKLRTLPAAILAGLASSLLMAAPAQAEVRETCAVAAHRGDWSVYTQNGLPAMRNAITKGADYLETDIRLTKDEVFVLMHNQGVAATTNGTGLVANKTLAQIKALRLDDGSRVPTLAEFLALAKPYTQHLLIDIKAMGDRSTYRDLKAQVNEFGNARVRIMSTSTQRLDTLESIAPGIPKGIITRALLTNEQIAPYDSIMLNFDYMTPEWLEQTTYPVYAWTLNDAERWAASNARRLAAVITDAPWDFMAWRETGCAEETPTTEWRARSSRARL